MAFEGLAEKLQAAFKKLSSRGRLTEKDVKEAMREVRMALLEADVNYKVVKDFIKAVTERAIGADVLDSLTPGQQVIKVVHEQLIALMGTANAKIAMADRPPTVLLMSGLQGSGKTTMSAKLGAYFKKQGKNPLLVACDVYRPAAIEQLKVVGGQAGVAVFEQGQGEPVAIAKAGVDFAKAQGYDLVIIDTAGRLHIDEELMGELERIKDAVVPREILLVVDAMTGQDAVNVAETFNNRLALDGVILTKLDGDSRGGAALSVRAVTGKPIKFAGVGEKISDLEAFHPDRMASRILGMGDVLSLIEKAQDAFDEKKAAELEHKMKTQSFTLEDFLDQFQQLKKMGPLSDILGMLPGGSKLQGAEVDEKAMGRTEAIIQSMTPKERRDPTLLNASRRRRIAGGSGTTIQDVNQLLRQYEGMRKMMKQFSEGGMRKGKGRFKMPF